MQKTIQPKSEHHYHFVTGKLAEHLVRETAQALSKEHGFKYSIGVMPITVAALMTPRWLLRHLDPPTETTHVIVPGYLDCGSDALEEKVQICVVCGPKDCRDLAEVFGGQRLEPALTDYDIQIIAEINHAPRMSRQDVVSRAIRLKADGADVIDFGCDPSNRCLAIGDYIAGIADEGIRVSVDTSDAWEASEAARRGASLVLSVNESNREHAVDWGVEVVVIPDQPSDKKSFEKTIDFLSKQGVPMRLDPILEPIGSGFAASLLRYAETRRDYPEYEMMMGIGNLTELTEVDSAGVNLLLLGICQELAIRSVLTTQVINWARSAVRECDVARRMVYFSINNGVPPKHLLRELVMLRDAKLRPFSLAAIESIATSLKDNHYRVLADDHRLHLLSAGVHLSGEDPFAVFEQLLARSESDNVDASHAFYLGYEMAKATIALQLGKQYDQDQALDWGILTKPEDLHRIKRSSHHRDRRGTEPR
ncbi:DUF6513 domain-containing protein [Novipirellula artificiosorum]|uniref:Pterin-binding domain-containing protein n=1 Tax=Novipirellula artificiosorum TaxID=2528016 RepID=A0A5C6DMX2_9BACT|nr:DUF6513 domain-containing protein [Novipirellula artificiosorum]TWU36209.1 hypothetical protein Poly41_39630 [Novipirellula artificiosorum]